LAALALHERLFPDLITAENLDDWMPEGYLLIEEKRVIEACEFMVEGLGKYSRDYSGRRSPDGGRR